MISRYVDELALVLHSRRLLPFDHDPNSTALPSILRLRLEPPRQQLAQPVRVGHRARQPRLPWSSMLASLLKKGKHAAVLGRGGIGQPIAPPSPDSVRPRFEGLGAVGPARVVAVEAQVYAPVAARVWVSAQGRVAARLKGAPSAVLLLLLLVVVVGWVGDVDAAEAEAVALEDRVGLAPPVSRCTVNVLFFKARFKTNY